MKLTRSGCIIPVDDTFKKELTVRPVVNTEFGIQPPAFKVFKTNASEPWCG